MSVRYVLHGTWLSGPTYKVALLLSRLGHKFDYVHIDLQKGHNRQSDFLSKNRFGQVPCLTDRETGYSLAQSGAIIEYVASNEGRFLPEDTLARQRARVALLGFRSVGAQYLPPAGMQAWISASRRRDPADVYEGRQCRTKGP